LEGYDNRRYLKDVGYLNVYPLLALGCLPSLGLLKVLNLCPYLFHVHFVVLNILYVFMMYGKSELGQFALLTLEIFTLFLA
jgi:hypothetical protein